ncbi:NUDIX domain-containing protein [Actinomyces slackii]|uniref:NUDIX domain n=1 Tax=Actinomyces slackii TaxID=52774 RepID=A0A448K981_9ACTO|nr:NUDIX domain-containing protein [Actinomyces slackii]VEG73420.1 NUDIX domain [Actinomyces slackii]
MPAHTLALIPASYVLLLAPTPGPGARALLQLRQGTGYMDGHWACGAAGHVDPGESALETAVREAREEIGVEAALADLEPLTTVHRSNEPAGAALEQRVDFFFALRRWTGEPMIREPAKTAALEWFDLESLPSPMPPHERRVLELLAASLDGASMPAIIDLGFRAPSPRLPRRRGRHFPPR